MSTRLQPYSHFYAWSSIEHIPALSFAAWQARLACVLIVRVHLDGQLVFRKDDLHQQRKTLFSSQCAVELVSKFFGDLAECSSLKRSVRNPATFAREPDFADRLIAHFVRRIKRTQVVRAPDALVKFWQQ